MLMQVKTKIPLFSTFRTIWGRYFFFQIFKVFSLFLICFYGLYVLIDFTTHANQFYHSHTFHSKEITLYYLSDFSKRLEVLIPFALLISTIKVISGLNIHRELVALMASGIPLKNLLRPFFVFGLAMVFLLYANTEWLVPKAMNALKHIDEAHQRQKRQSLQLPYVQHLVLEDDSTLLFQHYDSIRGLFYNAYWIPSLDEIYHFETLDPYAEAPVGFDVDYLERNSEGEIALQRSFQALILPKMRFNQQRLMETLTPAEELPLAMLLDKHPSSL